MLSLLSRFVTKIEKKFLNFSLGVARCESWSLACHLAISDGKIRESLLLLSNGGGIELAKKIISLVLVGNLIVFFIGIFELRSIKKIIQVLNNKPLLSEE